MAPSVEKAADGCGNGEADNSKHESGAKLNGTAAELHDESNHADDPELDKQKNAGKQTSKFNALWAKLGLDVPTLLMMMKAGIPPTIALAIYQADSVARQYSTLGYLPAIMSILGFAIMPRAKFVQTMTFNIISVCIGASVALLMIWAGVKAREHTQPAGSRDPYNSSQNAVCAIWLFFQIYLVNTIKAKLPQFAFPAIVYAIFVNVAATYGPQFTTMAQGIAFAEKLLEAFLTGFAITTGVSLIILPVTSRKVVIKEITGYVGLLRASLQAHKAYMQSLETIDMFSQVTGKSKKNKESKESTDRPEVTALRKTVAGLTELHGKLRGDLPFAKRELAYGKLGPDDLSEIFKLLRGIMIPTAALASLVDIFGRVAEINHWNTDDNGDNPNAKSEKYRKRAVSEWNEIMTVVHEPIVNIIQAMDQGLEHVLLRLQLAKPPRKKKSSTADDLEANGEAIKPGDVGFGDHLDKQGKAFYKGKELALRAWCERKGIQLSKDFFDDPSKANYVESEVIEDEDHWSHQRNQRQLYLILYMEFLLYSISRAILDFVRYADKAVDDGKLAKSHLISPGARRLRKWAISIFQVEDTSTEDAAAVGDLDANTTVVYMGEAYKSRKDPEHLPPQNWWEKVGNGIRTIPAFLKSSESAFGFRCACATMSIAITAYLHDSREFFMEQRLVWSMIMIAISMTPTSGQSVFNFILRILGTAVAMILAFLCWYIPDGHTAGVIVFIFVFVSLGHYIVLKQPQFIIIGIISVVTTTLIIGYELEVRKIGEAAATSNGQPFYDIYLLGPYRLATVAGGLFVAFIWTFFPYPISEHSALRQALGGALYLTANYYSIIHESVGAAIRGDQGDMSSRSSPGRKLEKARDKVFGKQMLVLDGLRTFSTFVKWEFPLGGKFPREEYETIVQCLRSITLYITLVGYAAKGFVDPIDDEDDPSETQWSNDFKRIITEANITSNEITSLLALLSSSITSGQPLPPYLATPQPYKLSSRLESIDRDILSLRHMAEPGYAAFAVMQISTRCIIGDMDKLMKGVKNLVGELDFSFHVVSTQASSQTSSSESLLKRSKQD